MADDGSRDRASEHAAPRRRADELLPSLMARLEASPLGELEVSQDGWRLRLRKPPEAATQADDGQPARGPASPPAVVPRARPGGGGGWLGEGGEPLFRIESSGQAPASPPPEAARQRQ